MAFHFKVSFIIQLFDPSNLQNLGYRRGCFLSPHPFFFFFFLETSKSSTSRFFSSVLFQCELCEYGICEVGPDMHRRTLMLWLHSSEDKMDSVLVGCFVVLVLLQFGEGT